MSIAIYCPILTLSKALHVSGFSALLGLKGLHKYHEETHYRRNIVRVYCIHSLTNKVTNEKTLGLSSIKTACAFSFLFSFL